MGNHLLAQHRERITLEPSEDRCPQLKWLRVTRRRRSADTTAYSLLALEDNHLGIIMAYIAMAYS